LNEPLIFEGIQKYRRYDELDVTINFSTVGVKCWLSKGPDDIEKSFLYDIPIGDLLHWSANNNKFVLTYKYWLSEKWIILVTNQAHEIVNSINAIFNKLTTQKE